MAAAASGKQWKHHHGKRMAVGKQVSRIAFKIIDSVHPSSPFFLRMSLRATHEKITTRINPQKIQSAVLSPNMVNSLILALFPLPSREGVDAGMNTDHLVDSHVIPWLVHDAIMDRPTPAPGSTLHPRQAKARGAVQSPEIAATGLELAVDIQHQPPAAQVIETEPFIADRIAVGQQVGLDHLHPQSINETLQKREKISEQPQTPAGLVRTEAGLHGSQLLGDIAAARGKTVDSALPIQIHIEPGSRRIADNAQTQLHLVERGIRQFQEENRVGVIRSGADLDANQRQAVRSNDPDQAFINGAVHGFDRETYQGTEPQRKQLAVDRDLFVRLPAIDIQQGVQLPPCCVHKLAISRKLCHIVQLYGGKSIP